MHPDHLITVEPGPVGWRVALDDLQPLMFLSGFEAKQHARNLAARLSRLGAITEVTIRDRSRGLVGAHHYVAR
jgi:hypothetical protein